MGWSAERGGSSHCPRDTAPRPRDPHPLPHPWPPPATGPRATPVGSPARPLAPCPRPLLRPAWRTAELANFPGPCREEAAETPPGSGPLSRRLPAHRPQGRVSPGADAASAAGAAQRQREAIHVDLKRFCFACASFSKIRELFSRSPPAGFPPSPTGENSIKYTFLHPSITKNMGRRPRWRRR